MKLGSQISITAILAVLLAASWIWLAGDFEAAQSREPSHARSGASVVLTEPVAFAEDKVVVRAIGTAEAFRSASIHPYAAGDVVAVTFKAGQPVAKGADNQSRLATALKALADGPAGGEGGA